MLPSGLAGLGGRGSALAVGGEPLATYSLLIQGTFGLEAEPAGIVRVIAGDLELCDFDAFPSTGSRVIQRRGCTGRSDMRGR